MRETGPNVRIRLLREPLGLEISFPHRSVINNTIQEKMQDPDFVPAELKDQEPLLPHDLLRKVSKQLREKPAKNTLNEATNLIAYFIEVNIKVFLIY